MFRLFNILLLSVFLAVLPNCLIAQDYSFEEAEEELVVLLMELVESPNATTNQVFTNAFRAVLERDGAFDYPFDHLGRIGGLASADGTVRVFTWNLPVVRGMQQYNGFVVVRKADGVQIFNLNDSRVQVADPQHDILSPGKWYGALYYAMHTEVYNRRTYYTLLGVTFQDLLSTKRVIEVMWIDDKSGEPVFGASIFNVRGRKLSRIIFEYSAQVTMLLQYSAEHRMLVFDHLVPIRPGMTGLYQFYGPDFSHDGFRFEKGEWHFESNIDLRNPRRDAPTPIDAPEENHEPGFLYQRQ
jgi:hypothetical protein